MSRSRSGRRRRAVLTALLIAAVSLPTAAAARTDAVPAPEPGAVRAIPDATAAELADRYRTVRDDITAAARAATDVGADKRATALRAFAEPDRQFLHFDGRDGGRSVEVLGDLATAEHIAVLVPGADNNIDRYRRLRTDATTLSERLGDGSAVVIWLGYRTPATVSLQALTVDRARDAAPALTELVTELHRIRPEADATVLCHSYGSTVCAQAAAGLSVAAVVLYGSPGTGFDTADELAAHAPVWVGRAAGDWIGRLPHLSLPLGITTLGLGVDPLSAAFGAARFPAGDGGHSDYLAPGSTALCAMAAIVTGERPERVAAC